MNIKYILVLILLVSIKSIESFENDYSIAETTNGYVQGVVHDTYRSFYGIPFATPPTVENNLRWKSPIPANDWTPNILNATVPKSGCLQNCMLPPETCPTSISEDCLYLNVFTPLDVNSTSDLRPVMAFIPGGRFEQGAASTILYTPETMVNTSGIIVVTLNYRLGVMGFLVGGEVGGNFGFQDQRLALQWIQNNIKYFGGDPNKVTLCGQSAGGSSIATHLTAKDSWNLFQGAIMESHPFTLGLKTLENARDYSDTFAKDVNCSLSDLNCLNSLTSDSIIEGQIKSQAKIDILKPLQSFLPWTPTIGLDDITEQPLTLFEKGDFYDVPMIVGTVSEEALLFIYQASPKNVSATSYKLAIDLIFLDHEHTIEENYPPIKDQDNRPVLSVLGTNYIFVCPTRYALEKMMKYKQTPIYYYQFSHVLSFDAWGPDYPYCVGHVCHGSELPFVFNSARYGGYSFTQAEQDLSTDMNAYWSNFINTANPNTGLSTSINWPEYDLTDFQNINFQTPPTIESNLLNSQCNVLDKVGYSPR
ncbi:hypothetical protein DICPUDRAFT_146986 [Dictyostelium purpureum]|uniref:Carboxylic ester hydrolase n=1 Tax=Dictyostelium purpureum TaxID=5786 RepID=F0Z7D2_DICPU|nr:uncharacterized protein DICPUDRAFT_146986 [Dictyostelium purpureum]EGC40157.1 hypothetical protein DICPUDRAFT_146986 [Dictyostelium purpureum]|eukprot:XP_003283347.1 hypothetical protein DICPUDRAFT_146986 [Dictyostelium purpureum]